jgi:hypothetical protein
MEPRTRDFVAAGVLAIVLIALVAVIVVGSLPKPS